MKKFKFLAVVFTTLVMGLGIYSCQKDNGDNPSLSDDNLNVEIRNETSSDRIIKSYVSTDPRHSSVAITMSIFFKSSNVRAAFDNYSRSKNTNVVLLADFMFNKVMTDENLISNYPASTGSTLHLTLCELMNEYLYDFPGIEISFVKDSDNEYPDILNDENFEVVSVYTDIDIYPSYKNGDQIGSYHVSDEPSDKTILKLQSSDVFDVINSTSINETNSNSNYADLLACTNLKDYINNTDFIPNDSKNINGCVIGNPLAETKILTFENIFSYFNNNCGDYLPPSTPLGPVNPPTGPTVEPCVADRDALRNERETIIDIKSPNGKSILRDCDTWCSYWNRDCIFQVDVFIPVLAASGQEFTSLNTLMRVLIANERQLRRKRVVPVNVPITEWLFLEGRHGDEWEFTWTGRHRRRGTTSETTVGVGFSGKVTFKKNDVGVEVNRSGNISHKIIRANEDCELGIEISRYCRSLPEFMSLGAIEYHVNEQ